MGYLHIKINSCLLNIKMGVPSMWMFIFWGLSVPSKRFKAPELTYILALNILLQDRKCVDIKKHILT